MGSDKEMNWGTAAGGQAPGTPPCTLSIHDEPLPWTTQSTKQHVGLQLSPEAAKRQAGKQEPLMLEYGHLKAGAPGSYSTSWKWGHQVNRKDVCLREELMKHIVVV